MLKQSFGSFISTHDTGEFSLYIEIPVKFSSKLLDCGIIVHKDRDLNTLTLIQSSKLVVLPEIECSKDSTDGRILLSSKFSNAYSILQVCQYWHIGRSYLNEYVSFSPLGIILNLPKDIIQVSQGRIILVCIDDCLLTLHQ